MSTTIIYETKILITERKTLKRIFGPKEDRNCTQRIKTNDELNDVIRNTDTIKTQV